MPVYDFECQKCGYISEAITDIHQRRIVCPECKNPISSEILLSRLEDFEIIQCGFCSKAYKVRYIVKSVELADIELLV